MNFLCSLCTATVDEFGLPIATADPTQPTTGIVCVACRLAACAERARTRKVRSDAGLRPRLHLRIATERLPYKD